MHNPNVEVSNVLLKDRSGEEIVLAAERWFALQSVAAVQVTHAEGFELHDREDNPCYRHLQVSFKFRTNKTQDEVSIYLRAVAMLKLTDLADLMRADVLENHLEGEIND